MTGNQKNTRTKKAIQAAVIELIAQKPLAKISIADITRVAKINRGTFYLHFLDKPDLIAQYENNLLTHLAQIIDPYQPLMPQSFATIQALLIKVLTYIQQEHPLFQALLSTHGDPAFANQLKQFLAEDIHAGLNAITQQHQTPIPAKYMQELAVDSLLGIVLVWLNDPHPDSIQTVAHLITQTRFLAPSNLNGFEPNS